MTTVDHVSRSDNTDKLGMTGLEYKWHIRQLPRGEGRELRRHWNKKQRARERDALSRQEEPEPSYPRGTVKYDYW